ncbi:hypothetical protein [Caloranaerobacter azorensis]|uniref:Uncharacterized protein n=2 Tax=Caloranaerobacter azorensis TaxID=116090 RepID=A0A1M5TDL7_9FIRM|nr:hypothetical protein [Caloranaerobacter azorensis]QIB27074.1 hypothetical protein G3A45_07095 [Caloranaerobacter azorensis]SHH48808.1 hypothetical protein SAMN02745135_00951 [Caloranaerobacter azorensis DSM 13643]
MDDEYNCPLVNRKINESYCLEYCEAVDGMLKMDIINGFKGTREEAQRICYNCLNHKDD